MKGNLSQNRLDDRNTSRSGIAFSPSMISGITGIIDVTIIYAVGIGLWLAYLGFNLDTAPIYLANISLNAVITVTAFHFAGLYKFENLTSPGKQFGQISSICIAVFTILVVLAFALKISTDFSRVWFFATLPSEVILISLLRIMINSFIRSLAKNGSILRQIAIVGATEQAANFIHTLRNKNNPWDKVVGIFDDRTDIQSAMEDIADIEYGGNTEDLINLIRKDRIDELIICFPWSEINKQLEIIDKLQELPIHIRLAADNIYYHIPNLVMSKFAGIPVLNVIFKPIYGWRFLVKFIEDRFLAILALALLSPLMILISIAIKLDSVGPIFYRQERYGYNNKIINVIKFRTMQFVQNDKHQQARPNDPRLTRIGGFLRKWSIDELPQLFNVIGGSMSMVGPRPHPKSASVGDNLYQDVALKYHARHRVKPGITGWAQVNGWRGATRNNSDIQNRVQHDLYYIENMGLLFDLKILFLTVFVVFSRKNAV